MVGWSLTSLFSTNTAISETREDQRCNFEYELARRQIVGDNRSTPKLINHTVEFNVNNVAAAAAAAVSII